MCVCLCVCSHLPAQEEQAWAVQPADQFRQLAAGPADGQGTHRVQGGAVRHTLTHTHSLTHTHTHTHKLVQRNGPSHDPNQSYSRACILETAFKHTHSLTHAVTPRSEQGAGGGGAGQGAGTRAWGRLRGSHPDTLPADPPGTAVLRTAHRETASDHWETQLVLQESLMAHRETASDHREMQLVLPESLTGHRGSASGHRGSPWVRRGMRGGRRGRWGTGRRP